ncbi:ubiquinone anaerobic biosynthesis protein UbiV [Microvirga brassicacearum]|uniref:Ubiquinone biosynthesis protein UbiV n=1 Tax=Microvirga brassicacearum TaxID=2580413 RepID=A0A5N3PAX4_9HYPH|nr:U32 family peptidase [Microvirga brassicacearum]KAB0266887.1 U32 family peptidase [Microvirga brassicacearum]
MKLTLGPVLYNWEPSTWRDFHFRIADEAPVDTVCVGEVVCSKRLPFFQDFIPEVVERLIGAGKEVLLSSLALITLERERKLTASLARESDILVEVNDITALSHLEGRPHAIGPYVNVYNESALAWLAGYGARRVCLSPELPASSIASLAKSCPEVALEVWAFGRVPLAISARCYHARLHKLTKDNCQFVCAKDPDGLATDTLDGKHFLSINGVQTLSSTYANLIEYLPDLAALGIASCRLSPQSCDMVAVAKAFRDVADGVLDPSEATRALDLVCDGMPFSDGFLNGVPGADYKSRGAVGWP